jgi:hypothetical protein
MEKGSTAIGMALIIKAISSIERSAGKAILPSRIELGWKHSGKKIMSKEEGKFIIITATTMRANSRYRKKKGKDSINGRIKPDIRDSKGAISSLASAGLNMSTMSSMKGRFPMEKEMGLGFIDIRTGISLEVSGRMMRS